MDLTRPTLLNVLDGECRLILPRIAGSQDQGISDINGRLIAGNRSFVATRKCGRDGRFFLGHDDRMERWRLQMSSKRSDALWAQMHALIRTVLCDSGWLEVSRYESLTVSFQFMSILMRHGDCEFSAAK